jgi:hypothetical protein
MTIRKRDLREVEKDMFYVVAWSCLFILCILRSLNVTWARAGGLKTLKCKFLPPLSIK